MKLSYNEGLSLVACTGLAKLLGFKKKFNTFACIAGRTASGKMRERGKSPSKNKIKKARALEKNLLLE